MTPLVYSDRIAEIAFWSTVGIWAVGERVLSFRDIRSGAWRSGQDRGSLVVLVVAVIAGFLAAVTLPARHVPPLPVPWLWLALGLAIAWSGMLLRAWAVVTLGRSFTTAVVVRSEQRVVASGPYRLVRHPSYLGLLIFFLGFGLGFGNVLSPVVLVAFSAVGLVYRITVEEAALRRELGDRYDSYAVGRARLLPRIW